MIIIRPLQYMPAGIVGRSFGAYRVEGVGFTDFRVQGLGLKLYLKRSVPALLAWVVANPF